MDLAAAVIASALGQVPGNPKIRLQLLQTTLVATFVPEDLLPPAAQAPSGLARVSPSAQERLVEDYAALVARVARTLPVNEEADREVDQLLANLQREDMLQPLDAPYEDD